jgi:hypothetical protein
MPLAVNSGCRSSPWMMCWLPEIPWNVPASQESRVLQPEGPGSSGSSSGGQLCQLNRMIAGVPAPNGFSIFNALDA